MRILPRKGAQAAAESVRMPLVMPHVASRRCSIMMLVGFVCFLLICGASVMSNLLALSWMPVEPTQVDASAFTLAKACLERSPYNRRDLPHRPLPRVDLEAHYVELIRVTAPLRTEIPVHQYAGWKGMWIENRWISKWCCNRSIEDFGGLVPLFVQWVDLWRADSEYAMRIRRELVAYLRPDVIYVTVSQSDTGIQVDGWQASRRLNPALTANVLVLSAGGFGHVPIPLLHRPRLLVERDSDYFPLVVSFVGTFGSTSVRLEMNRTLHRIRGLSTVSHGDVERRRGPPRDPLTLLIMSLSRNSNNATVVDSSPIDSSKDLFDKLPPGCGKAALCGAFYRGPEWNAVMNASLYQLAPRGFGRTSFRLAEAIQQGYLPVYLYDDIEWLPYKTLTRSWLPSLHISQLDGWLERLVAMTPAQRLDEARQRRSKMIETIASHWTYDGVLMQIDWFLSGDARSDLECERHPWVYDEEEEVDCWSLSGLAWQWKYMVLNDDRWMIRCWTWYYSPRA